MTTQAQATRVCIRLPCEIPAIVSFSGSGSHLVKKATISNISTTGVQILCPSFVATGQTIQARFKAPGQASKITLRAEVVRIESLQGRMIGHYPYALGAKFIAPEKSDERKITNFISGKITCAPLRFKAGWLFLILGIANLLRAILHSALATSDLSNWDFYGLSNLLVRNWLLNPILLEVMMLGSLATAILYVTNIKTWMIRLGFIFGVLQTIFSLTLLTARRELLFGTASDQTIWCVELPFLTAGVVSIILALKLIKETQKMDKIVSADRASSAPNRPTFTIL